MSISSDGILVFGFPVGDDDEPPEWLAEDEEDGEREEFDAFVCRAAGLPSDATWEDRKPVITACPADMTMFCSYEYPMFILALRGTERRVYRGGITEVDVASLSVPPEDVAALREWCGANDISWQEPKWLLVSMYG